MQLWAAMNVFVSNSLKLCGIAYHLLLKPPLLTSYSLKPFFKSLPPKMFFFFDLSKCFNMVRVEPFLKSDDVLSSQWPSSGKQGHIYCLSLRNTIHLLSAVIVICLGLCGNPFEWGLYLSICSVLCIQSGLTVRDVYLSNYGNWLFLAAMLTSAVTFLKSHRFLCISSFSSCKNTDLLK